MRKQMDDEQDEMMRGLASEIWKKSREKQGKERSSRSWLSQPRKGEKGNN